MKQVRIEGYAVGLFPSADVVSEDLDLDSGDRLFLYSDGLMDCANPGGVSFGSRRLEEAIKAGRSKPLSAAVADVRTAVIAVARFRGVQRRRVAAGSREGIAALSLRGT